MKKKRTTRFAGEFRCVVCGTLFIAHRSHAKTHNASCRKELSRRLAKAKAKSKKRG